MKRNVLYTALLLGLASGAQAGVAFDPDGSLGVLGTIDVGAFDWNYSSFLAKGGNTAISNFIISGGQCGAVGLSCDFDVYTHARLIGTTNQAGSVNAMPGLGTTYEITMVGRFKETVTGVLPAGMLGPNESASFATKPTPGFDLVEWYFDSTVDTNDVDGAGFDDGDVILRGTTIGASTGLYQIDLFNFPAPVALDQFNVNNLPGQLTQTGAGNQGTVSISGLTWDPAFFKNGLAALTLLYSNISQNLPFVSVDPSDCYTLTTDGVPVLGNAANTGKCIADHVAGPFAVQPGAPVGGYVPVTGLVNSAPQFSAGLGPDFVAQTDINSPVSGLYVPEPGSLALLGLGLGALGLSLRRKMA